MGWPGRARYSMSFEQISEESGRPKRKRRSLQLKQMLRLAERRLRARFTERGKWWGGGLTASRHFLQDSLERGEAGARSRGFQLLNSVYKTKSKLKLQSFGYLMRRTDSLERMLGTTEGRRRRGQQRMRWFGWHHRLDGHECEQTLRDCGGQDREGQGSLVCCTPWGGKESDTP